MSKPKKLSEKGKAAHLLEQAEIMRDPTKAHKTTGRCYETHPALDVAGFKIYGGSCSNPVVKDADIYVGFDYGHRKDPRAYPWNEGESFQFPITDMHAPDDPVEFRKLIDWIAVQLTAGKKIHLGCIGGHGRTGTVLAALVSVMAGEKDAITYVRDHYCKKAVESQAQIRFLATHYGVTEVTASKGASNSSWGMDNYSSRWDRQTYHGGTSVPSKGPLPVKTSLPSHSIVANCAKNPIMIWGSNVLFDKA